MNNNILDNDLTPKSKFNPKFAIVAIMIVVAAASRFMPHPPNFTPIGGMALFGAAYFAKKYWAFIIPFIALFISDLILNNVVYAAYYDGFTLMPGFMFWTYGAMFLIVLLGTQLLKKVNILNVVGTSVAASLVFFLVTNFGSWFIDPANLYADNIAGVGTALAAGLPYFWNTLAGNLVYAGVMFGSYEMMKNAYPHLTLKNA